MPVVPNKQLRGAAFVSRVLDVAVDELMRYDYGTLSVESIASAAGVNKTSVYRRWRTLEALVREAGERLLATMAPPKDTGSFRGDLQHYFRGVRELLIAVRIRTPAHIKLPGAAPTEVENIRRSFEKQKEKEFRGIFARAVARGEIPKRTNVDLIGNVLAGAMIQLTLFSPDGCDDAKIAEAIDLVLSGVPGWKAAAQAVRRGR